MDQCIVPPFFSVAVFTSELNLRTAFHRLRDYLKITRTMTALAGRTSLLSAVDWFSDVQR